MIPPAAVPSCSGLQHKPTIFDCKPLKTGHSSIRHISAWHSTQCSKTQGVLHKSFIRPWIACVSALPNMTCRLCSTCRIDAPTNACCLLCYANGPVNTPQTINQAILQSPFATPDSPLSVLLQLLLGHASRLGCLVTERGVCKLSTAVKQVLLLWCEAPCVTV